MNIIKTKHAEDMLLCMLFVYAYLAVFYILSDMIHILK